MTITGQSYISGVWQKGESNQFQGVDPTTGLAIEPIFYSASTSQMNAAVDSANQAVVELNAHSLIKRSSFLHACADEIMSLGDALIDRMCLETGYPKARSEVERARTCAQLRMFADYILSGTFFDVRIDTAQPQRVPLARPDLRSMNQAIGPVVVFGASNFPLAYSVAGGDTASAFAVGCPVIVKSHASHPGTSELVAQAIVNAVIRCDMPLGTFNFINGNGNNVGAYLVKAPAVKAVGFTGSLAGGMALFKLANERPEPIPVFAEMGSINPVFLFPEALSSHPEQLAKQFIGSLTLGTGQFCVNPGLVVAVQGPDLDNFVELVAGILEQSPAGVMLNEGVYSSFYKSSSAHANMSGIEVISKGVVSDSSSGFYAQAQLFMASAGTFLLQPELQDEVFGPSSLIVICENSEQLLEVAISLKGQLTATIHATEEEMTNNQKLVDILMTRVGRLVINGFPTGVEVTPAMVHGGPFPSSTDSRFSSVGTAAIKRFIRPVCYQNYPEKLLPDALRDSNPLNLLRVVNGVQSNLAVPDILG